MTRLNQAMTALDEHVRDEIIRFGNTMPEMDNTMPITFIKNEDGKRKLSSVPRVALLGITFNDTQTLVVYYWDGDRIISIDGFQEEKE